MSASGFSRRSLSRREFVGRSAGIVAGALAWGCVDPAAPEETPGRLPTNAPRQRVAIVGAGLSGLVAGYELERAGHHVSLFEARSRIGGRVLTLREPFAAGHLAEAGAARIRPEHDLTIAYARHFGLELVRFYPDSGSFLRLDAGVRQTLDPGAFLSSRPDYLKIRGGTDLLPRAFADALEGRVDLAAPVARLEQDDSMVRLIGEDGWIRDADRAICTVPLPLLDRIEFSPPLSGQKASAAAGDFAYRPATRVFVRFDERFWAREGYNGWAVTDWPEEVWHPTWDRPGPGGVLLSYVRGDRALELDALVPEARLQRVVEHWEDLLPGATARAEGGVSHSWNLDPWSRGGWAAPTSTQEAELGSHVARREARVHFAGEHASHWRGWMQGALASGIRAAEEAVERARLRA